MKYNHWSFTLLLLIIGFSVNAQQYTFETGSSKNGFDLKESRTDKISLDYRVNSINLNDITVDGEVMKNISLSNVFLPGEAGMPNLPTESKFLAIPEGATPKLVIKSIKTETIKDVEIAPAAEIVLDTEPDKAPVKNSKVYQANEFYPAQPFLLSEVKQLRGVDAVLIGITPFQYNPVTKELIVYTEINAEIVFEGGKGYFAEEKYRSPTWEGILDDQLFNYNSLPAPNFSNIENNAKDGEADYVIITIDDAEFIAKAEEIAEFRRKQGISTMVVTTTDVGGNSVTAIENWVDNAYENWTNPVDAVLLIGDYSTGTDGICSFLYSHPSSYPDYASDNRFADVDGDDLPEIVFARIAAENTSQLDVMVSKFMDYEQNPPTDYNFYNNPITALGWQTERWFQICSETIGGFWRNELGKDPVRINAVYDGDPAIDPWSDATNTSTVLDYFGPSGLGYIPTTPDELGGWSGGDEYDVRDAINSGAFMLQHRDHGIYDGWGEPYFRNENIPSLTNVDNKLPYILSINCETGAFHNPTGEISFAETFHRYTHNGENSGALGMLAATETSYSFVNDTYVWGVYDNMWQEFMPSENTEFPVNFVYPAFGSAAGKIFLAGSSWPYNTDSKQVTYRLFHHHGDAYLNVYTEVPQNLNVTCQDALVYGNSSIDIGVEENATIAITYFDDGEGETQIIAVAQSVNGTTTVNLPTTPLPGSTMLVTITKQNYFRYTKEVSIVPAAVPYDIVESYTIDDAGNGVAEFGETFNLDLTIKNVGVDNSENVEVTLTTTDPNVISLTNNTGVSFGTIAPDASISGTGNFTVELANDVEDGTVIQFSASITDDADTYNSTLSLTVAAPEFNAVSFLIDDSALGNNDGILDAEETADIVIEVQNIGHADVTNVIGYLATASTDLTINSATTSPISMNADGTSEFVFNVTAATDVELGTPADLDFSLTAGTADQYTYDNDYTINIGEIPLFLISEHTEVTTCAGIFLDSGGENGEYQNYEDYTITFYPGDNEAVIHADFTYFDVEYQASCGYDVLYIYDGENASATLIGEYCGTNSPGLVEATNAAGALTFVFDSDMSVTEGGWAANIICYRESATAGTASANQYSVCDGGTADLSLNGWDGDEIQWQISTDNVNWSDIAGATSENYTTDALSNTTYYRAMVTMGTDDPVFSNVITIAVVSETIAGTADATETFVCENQTTTLSLTGYFGNIQWQKSADNATWSNISGATSENFTTDALAETTYFRAFVSEACGDETSNSIEIEVTPAPVASFTADATNEPEISFTNTSQNADTYTWNFGDGVGTSDETSPVYTYTTNGTFTVSLSAANDDCPENVVTEEITIAALNANELNAENYTIYPNPATQFVNINLAETPQNASLTIYELTGRVMIEQNLNSTQNKIDLQTLQAGAYLLEIEDGGKTLKTMIVVE